MSLELLQEKAMKRMGTGTHLEVKRRILELIEIAYSEGIYVLITDGYRSNAEQDILYAQGRTTPGKIVTNAKGGESNHNRGVAVDFCLTDKMGKTAQWKFNREWKRVAILAKRLGFTWGGDWVKFPDYPHLEMRVIPSKPLERAIVPYPGHPLKRGSKGKDVERVQRALKLTVDGSFGSVTEYAVEAYQRRQGLLPDGIIGVHTWNTIF